MKEGQEMKEARQETGVGTHKGGRRECRKCGGVITKTFDKRLYCERCGPQSGPRGHSATNKLRN
jgi:ribosomal protein S27AE